MRKTENNRITGFQNDRNEIIEFDQFLVNEVVSKKVTIFGRGRIVIH